LIYKRKYTGKNTTFFYAAYGEQAEVDGIVFGPEGQCWEFMPLADYINHPDSIPDLVARIKSFIGSNIEVQ